MPGELKSTLDGIVFSHNSAIVSPEQKEKIVAAAAIIDKQVGGTTDDGVRVGSLPARVYVHIAEESQESFANQLQQALTKANFIAPGVENVGAKPHIKIPLQTEIRYFKDEDKAEAQEIANLLKRMNPALQLLDAPRKVGNGKGARPRHFEIWFAKT